MNNKIFENIIIDLNDDVKEVFRGFSNSECSSNNQTITNSFIKAYLSNRIPTNRNDFSDDTLYKDINICSPNYQFESKTGKYRSLTPHEKAMLKQFYIYLLNKKIGNFHILNEELLAYNNLYKMLLDNYKFVTRDVFQDLPICKKWLLIENGSVYPFDFSIYSEAKETAVKKYVWNSVNPNISTICSRQKYYHDFLSLIPDDEYPFNVGPKAIMDYKEKYRKNHTDSSLAVAVNSIKGFVEYLENSKILSINPFVKKMLTSTNTKAKPNTKAFKKEEIEQILKAIESEIIKEENNKLKYKLKLCYAIIYYVCHTSMRIETILRLKLSDFHKESAGVYYYLAASKTKDNELYNVSSNIAKIHESIVNESKTIRDNGEERLFIYERLRSNALSTINTTDIRNVLNKVCLSKGIDNKGISGLRNYFMQTMTEHVMDSGGDKAFLESATRHSLRVNYDNYYQNDMTDICLKMYGVYIGDVDLKGIVVSKKIEIPKERLVQNGCGYCNNPDCKDKSKLDCLMCRYFVTCPENIEYFENKIKTIDEQILEQDIPHEKEFLITKKSLYVKYLTECYKAKEAN